MEQTAHYYREAPGEGDAHLAWAEEKRRTQQGLETGKAKAFSKKLAQVLELDEMHTETVLWYFLRHDYLRVMSSRPREQTFRFTLDDDLTDVFVFYNTERVSAIKAIASICRIAIAPTHPHQKLAARQMEHLVSDGFHSVIAFYHSLANAQMPVTALSEAQRALWVSRNVAEQLACLELVFLILYGQDTFHPAQFVELLSVFEEQAFGVSQVSWVESLIIPPDCSKKKMSSSYRGPT